MSDNTLVGQLLNLEQKFVKSRRYRIDSDGVLRLTTGQIVVPASLKKDVILFYHNIIGVGHQVLLAGTHSQERSEVPRIASLPDGLGQEYRPSDSIVFVLRRCSVGISTYRILANGLANLIEPARRSRSDPIEYPHIKGPVT